jgi:hypothetical protein
MVILSGGGNPRRSFFCATIQVMTIISIADITPGGTATPLAANNINAVWVQLVATGTSARVGDANVGSGRGIKLPAGVPVILPRCSFTQGGYNLASINVYATGGDSISVIAGV